MICRLIISLLLLTGCARHEARKEIHFQFSDGTQSPFVFSAADQLSALAAADPLADAKAAYRKEDSRLIAVLGIGVSTPGVAVESSKFLRGAQSLLGTKTISGTSDAISGLEHEQLCRAAHEYAVAYNAEMIVLLTNGGKPR